jgi:mannosyltransferase OCH1-like enzyme
MIPKIIHQLWSDTGYPLPGFLKEWSKTWKEHHPAWQYEFWDNSRMNSFIHEFFPEYVDTYDRFPYDIQRWDAIRYLILWQMGGMYVDFDYECLESFEDILSGKECCFSMEPDSHLFPEGKKIPYNFNNAMMACMPRHPFMQLAIQEAFSKKVSAYPVSDQFHYVLSTTGPYMLIRNYEKYEQKDEIYLIPAEWVSPFGIGELKLILNGAKNEHFEKKLQTAKAIHYFLGNWQRTKKNRKQINLNQ